MVFVRVYQQQRALVAINRGEACEVALEALPLLNVAGWQCKTGSGNIREGRLSFTRDFRDRMDESLRRGGS
ncbi:maltodextrin glucosidase [Salmonella enterica subsp. enterica]|nr:maltodextrin glucosidase [Salmonella enterica subsp. enterica]